ncbi:6-phosphogluconolactonase [Pleomorphochaeta sp. DL1XJH-081]|uniref:6-phosphogluconolactonase n=1 Tax=Pleomorphochaeta sp. DL1XJH-081 TaxID=3409690 RepID=UPI003BB5C6AE
MEIYRKNNAREMGEFAAELGAQAIIEAINKQGSARIILATGASQFEMIKHLVTLEIPWSKVEMYHLDEYCALPMTHIASFRKYLKERFVDIVHPAIVHYVDGEGNVDQHITKLTESIRERPIDVAFVGIGENAHIAFNDPPANFTTLESYIVVNLTDDCKQQQVSEGWFATKDDVPAQAISMTVHQMLNARKIICTVPGSRKAKAIEQTVMAEEISPMVPATMLWNHPDCAMVLDADSASLL